MLIIFFLNPRADTLTRGHWWPQAYLRSVTSSVPPWMSVQLTRLRLSSLSPYPVASALLCGQHITSHNVRIHKDAAVDFSFFWPKQGWAVWLYFRKGWHSVASSFQTTVANFGSSQTLSRCSRSLPLSGCRCQGKGHSRRRFSSGIKRALRCFLFSKLKGKEQSPASSGILNWKTQAWPQSIAL